MIDGGTFVDDELGLPSGAFQRHDGDSSNMSRCFRSEVASHEVEA